MANEDTAAKKLQKLKDSIPNIKSKLKTYKSGVNDKGLDQTISLPNTGGSFFQSGGVKIKQSMFDAKPVFYLKLYPILKSKTNATDAQMEVIEGMNMQAVKSLYS